MKADAYRDLQLLTELSCAAPVTQRRLAKKYGLALGLTNFLIRRLVRKGYVKIVTLERRRLRYLLTPQGVAAKARLTYEYLRYSLELYRSVRGFLAGALSEITRSGGRATVLIGTSEVAEIAFLILQQHGVDVLAVLDDGPAGSPRFMSRQVEDLGRLPELSYDWIVVASFTDARGLRQRLAQWGVPPEKIISIPDEERRAAARGPAAEVLLTVPATVEGGPVR